MYGSGLTGSFYLSVNKGEMLERVDQMGGREKLKWAWEFEGVISFSSNIL